MMPIDERMGSGCVGPRFARATDSRRPSAAADPGDVTDEGLRQLSRRFGPALHQTGITCAGQAGFTFTGAVYKPGWRGWLPEEKPTSGHRTIRRGKSPAR